MSNQPTDNDNIKNALESLENTTEAPSNNEVTGVEVLKGDKVMYEDGDFEDYNAEKQIESDLDGKSAKVPNIELLKRLHTRNEYLIGSHHPLRETLINQTGRNEKTRQQFLQKYFNFSKEHLIHVWQPRQQGSSLF